MSAYIKLDSNKITDCMDRFQKAVNVVPLELVEQLAAVLRNTGDDNKVTQDLLDQCRKYEKFFNEYTASVDAAYQDLQQVLDLSEYHAKKASVGELNNRDLSFSNSKIDVSKATMR